MGLPLLDAHNQKQDTTPISINYVSDYYDAFLAKFVKGTSDNYRTDLKLFFKIVYNKEVKFVTLEDIKNTKMIDAMKYAEYLLEQVEDKKTGGTKPRYKNASFNRKINAVKSFFRFLSKEYKDISDEIFHNIDSKNTELDALSYDGLDWQEAISIWEYASENFGADSNQLSMLMKLASVTSVRLDALIGSSWENDWFKKNERGVDINFIRVIDKSKPHIKPISPQFYDELQEKLGTTGELFPNLYPNKVGNCLKKTLEALGFDSRRRIVFHSFKKTGVMRALEKTGNMYKAKQQGNHKSMNTAEKYYLKYKECLMDMTSYSMDVDVDIKDELADYNKESIIDAINLLSDGSKFELLRLLKEKGVHPS